MSFDQIKTYRELWIEKGGVAIFYRDGKRKEENKISSPAEFKTHIRQLLRECTEEEEDSEESSSSYSDSSPLSEVRDLQVIDAAEEEENAETLVSRDSSRRRAWLLG